MQTLTVPTRSRADFIDITGQVAAALREEAADDGVCCVYVPHTTAGITINENADPAVRHDMMADLGRLVPQSSSHAHAEGNSDSHLKASMMGFSVMIPVSGGTMQLGTWQGIYFCEFDGPRRRRVIVQMLPARPEQPSLSSSA